MAKKWKKSKKGLIIQRISSLDFTADMPGSGSSSLVTLIQCIPDVCDVYVNI